MRYDQLPEYRHGVDILDCVGSLHSTSNERGLDRHGVDMRRARFRTLQLQHVGPSHWYYHYYLVANHSGTTVA
jgi:hypothetical protein